MNLLRSSLVLVAASSSVFSFAFSRVIVFGDSLSDAGNVHGLTFGLYPPAPYWNGRFSNGPTWVEGFATDLGHSAQRSWSGGTNYAYGGAEANTNSALSGQLTPNVGTQIGSFSSGDSFTGDELVVVLAGANDFFEGNTNGTQVAGFMNTHFNTLYGLGARNFLIGNIPDLGLTPSYLGGVDQAAATQFTSDFNTALSGHITSLQGQSGVSVVRLDLYQIFVDIMANPGAFGLSNVTQSFLDTGGNPDDFLFWDTVHPTRQVHQIARERALAAVPEPASMVGLGALGLLALRRRKRA